MQASIAALVVVKKKGGKPMPRTLQKKLKIWRKVFNTLDHDRTGTLHMRDVREAVNLLFGEPVCVDEYDLVMKESDQESDEKDDVLVNIQEFAELVSHVEKTRSSRPLMGYSGSCLGPGRKLPLQDAVLTMYNSKPVVYFVACCIVGNFVFNIVEKQIDPDPNDLKYAKVWKMADTTFNIIFVIELTANMWSYGGPVKRFWKSGWNVFDTIIVTVGVLTMANVLGPPLDKLKLMRAFRVFRLFKRVKSLNAIIMALLRSIPGVINAFVVMFIFFCIYAIMAVELFRDFGKGGFYITHDSTNGHNYTVDAGTQRGYVQGIEYYGTFMRALYTLFQVMTGESWSEAISRPLLFGLYKNSSWTVGCFYVTFILLVQLVLINVVVAVLLEKFGEGEDHHVSLDEKLEELRVKKKSCQFNDKVDKVLSKLERLSVLEQSVAKLQAEMLTLRARRKAKKKV